MDTPPTFAAEADRARLTPAALRAMLKLAEIWDLADSTAAALTGVTVAEWESIWEESWTGTLSADQLTRVSLLLGIFRALNELFSDRMSDRWPHLPNRGPLFQGRTPVEAMREGGIPAMREVRRHVEAQAGPGLLDILGRLEPLDEAFPEMPDPANRADAASDITVGKDVRDIAAEIVDVVQRLERGETVASKPSINSVDAESLMAALRHLSIMAWQPIDTAPRNPNPTAAPIVVWVPTDKGGEWLLARWGICSTDLYGLGEVWYARYPLTPEYGCSPPTHWLPIKPPGE